MFTTFLIRACAPEPDRTSAAGGASPVANENTTESGSQASSAYEAIRQAIIEWDLRPGEHVTEHGLVDITGFGRASVRAALTRLRHEGLVIAMPRRGYQVA